MVTVVLIPSNLISGQIYLHNFVKMLKFELFQNYSKVWGINAIMFAKKLTQSTFKLKFFVLIE